MAVIGQYSHRASRPQRGVFHTRTTPARHGFRRPWPGDGLKREGGEASPRRNGARPRVGEPAGEKHGARNGWPHRRMVGRGRSDSRATRTWLRGRKLPQLYVFYRSPRARPRAIPPTARCRRRNLPRDSRLRFFRPGHSDFDAIGRRCFLATRCCPRCRKMEQTVCRRVFPSPEPCEPSTNALC